MSDSNSNFFLGVDGGATKTTATIIDESNKILGQGSSAGSNANVFGFKKAIENIKVAVNQTLNNIRIEDLIAACLAIAGVNSKKDQKNWQKALRDDPELSKLPQKLLIVNDTQAALRSGTDDKNAIVIIAGTGSNCSGRNEKGQEASSGGQDWILADEGSAYAIGSAILHRVTQALDGRGKKTILTDLLFEKFKINSLRELSSLVYQKPWNKSDIATVAPLLELGLSKKDSVSTEILNQIINNLVLMIKAVTQRLDLTGQQITIVITGSVFNIQQIKEKLKESILKFAPKSKFVEPRIDCATAAAYLAKNNT